MAETIFRGIVVFICTIAISCASTKKVVDDDFATDAEMGTELTLDDVAETADSSGSGEKDEFAEFEKASEQTTEQTTEQAQPEVATQPEQSPETVAEQPIEQTAEQAPVEPVAVEQGPVGSDANAYSEDYGVANVKDLKFLGNQNGGTLVIDADKPLRFKTRLNSSTNQLVVEVQNAVVPERLKRPLITKDMTSTIGSIDVYQSSSSSIARFVVQLRPGAVEPLVQPEGKSLLVIGTPNYPVDSPLAQQPVAPVEDVLPPEETSKILTTSNIEEFLAGSTKFYGRPISIETTGMDVRDILKFISEESGVNMIFDESITGSMSMKLRKVPWDQALITVLKANKLSYTRQGQVLRIAPLAVLVDEEVQAAKLKNAKQKLEPLVVKNFQINYADIEELERKIRDYITGNVTQAPVATAPGEAPQPSEGGDGDGIRGRVTADKRTNVLIVTEVPSKIGQIEKLIKLLDMQPQQVLIEGRIIEASETYGRTIGVNFGANTGDLGSDNPLNIPGSTRILTSAGRTSAGPLVMSPSMTFAPTANGSFAGSMWFGRIGAFGMLSARLALDETEEKVKILSSPRVAVLHANPATISQNVSVQIKTGETTTTTGVQSSFETQNVGINLNVTPYISNMGTIKLDLDINRGAVAIGGAVTERSVKTSIIVKNSDTAVIGGIFSSDASEQRTGIPGLKDIPVLGTLFRADSKTKQKSELMFFISPKILKSLDSNLLKASDDLKFDDSSVQ